MWTFYINGASNNIGVGLGVVLIDLNGITIKYVMRLGLATTNNEAEYEGTLAGLRIIHDLKVDKHKLYDDSTLAII